MIVKTCLRAWFGALLCLDGVILTMPLKATEVTDQFDVEVVSESEANSSQETVTAKAKFFEKVTSFPAEEAFQAVAVDSQHVFAIGSTSIGMYSKSTLKRLKVWSAPKESLVKHLNSGVVFHGKLYCANSNWPKSPLINTVEIFDAQTLEPIEQRRFDEKEAAINWIDRFDGAWWIAFAFYGELAEKSFLVRYDDQWNPSGRWTFPANVIKRFHPNSNSGGSFGPDGVLYVTGHDHQEVYALRVPKKSGEMEYLETLEVPMEGQGIAWDRTTTDDLYGISRKRKLVLSVDLKGEAELAGPDTPQP